MSSTNAASSSSSGARGHERASTSSSAQGGSHGQSHSRRAPSASSIASSGTAYSSTRGSYAGSASGGPGASSTAHLESTVTKLLVSTKQLLEGLTEWSQGKISEEQVSDIYVRLGNCFNAAVAAFTREGISMRDLKEVPQLLRVRLEAAINEEASAATLHEHLPKIRPIILDLLRGLREKQDQHQAMLAAQARATNETDRSASIGQVMYQSAQGPSSARRQDSLSSHGTSQREDSNIISREHGPMNGRISPNTQLMAGQSVSRPSSRTAHHVGSSESDPSSISRRPSTESSGSGVGARRPSNTPRPNSLVKSRSASSLRQGTSGSLTNGTPPPETPLPPLPPPLLQSSGLPAQSASADPRRALPLPGSRLLQIPDGGAVATPPVPRMGPVPANVDLTTTPPSLQQPLPSPSAFSTPPRSTLRPMGSASTSAAASGSVAPSSVPDDASLEALKKADPLARRASKRFSAYTFSKISSSNLTGSASSPGGLGMTGLGFSTPGRSPGIDRDDSTAREYISGSASGEKATRKPKKARSPRSDSFEPPVPALPPLKDLPKLSFSSDDSQAASTSQNAARKKRVSVVAEETEDQLEADEKGEDAGETESTASNKTLTPQAAEKKSRTLPRSESSTSIASTASAYSNMPDSSSQPLPGAGQPAPEVPRPPRSVFLQLGRDMKKAKLDPSSWPTFAGLRTLFTDKFAYNPGLADFPAIYLRDPGSGVQYELEDVEEIKESSVLSLNIEPLDQVKQHIDEGLASLTRELKELKAAMNSSKRASVALIAAQNAGQPAQSILSPGSSRQPPTELQLHTAAQGVLEMKRKLSTPAVAKASTTDGANHSEVSTPATPITEARVQKLASELKSSIQEVRNARREIGVLRQMYTDFRSETSAIIGTLRSQTEKVKDIANSKVAGSRAFIDTGKAKLDTRSQDLLTKIEDLQDSIDDLKNDVTVKRMRPRPKQTESVQATISSSQAELDDLSKYIATVKPMWKKTWEAELQNIVEEQGLLNYQEELLADLKTDHENVVALFTQIQEYVSLQHTAKGRKPSYRPPSPDGTHEGLSTVLLEVKGRPQASDKRMKAIEMAEKARQKEAAERTDEFAAELGGFVDGRKLKRTGGAEEAERIRQMKSEASLKAMFQQPTPVAATALPTSTAPKSKEPEPVADTPPASVKEPAQEGMGEAAGVPTEQSSSIDKPVEAVEASSTANGDGDQ